jgi:phenylacetate-CoA ligase
MLIVRGINVFPSQIEDVLVRIEKITDQFEIYLDRNKKKLDEITVRVELDEDAFTGEIGDLATVKRVVEGELKSVLNIRANVDLVEKGTIPRSTGKAKRVFDRREAI